MKKICILTLGCPKNIVNSEKIMSVLVNVFALTENVNEADIIMLNTCGFLQSAIDETFEYIHKLEKLKTIKPEINIIIFGCAVARLRNEGYDLENKFKLVSKFVRSINENNVLDVLLNRKIYKSNNIKNIRSVNITSPYSAYLKISDGCNRNCSFCTIPGIKGKYKSTKKHILIEEANQLIDMGIKEIVLIGQVTTDYGYDVNTNFYEFLLELSDIRGLEWIRIMYTYPKSFDFRIINLMKEKENICKYIDIPFQHIDYRILIAMRRVIEPRGTRLIYRIINKMREELPDIHIRTTFITGFPGETDEMHNNLLQFINETKFDRLGVFKYSREPNTKAYNIEPQIAEDVKQKRFDELMIAQQKISLENNQKKIGTQIKVLIESDYNDKYYIGRSEFDAPEIDNCVYIDKNSNAKIGNIETLTVYAAEEYEVYCK